jgi:hypothetical protein
MSFFSWKEVALILGVGTLLLIYALVSGDYGCQHLP